MSEIKEQLEGLKIERDNEEARSKGPWMASAIMVLLVMAFAIWWLTLEGAAEVSAAVARQVRAESGSTVLNASGYVTARRRATVSSKVTGKIVEVLIEEGMAVEEGQVLARLDASNVGAALRLSEARRAAAEAVLEETRVRLAEGELELGRTRELVANQIASQADLDAAVAQVDSWRARLESQIQEVAVARRSILLRRQDLDDTVIRAPFTGIVVAKNAQPGEMISPIAGGGFTRTGIGTIVDMSSLEIEVDVNESYIQRVEAGQQVLATLDAYPVWRIPARVIAIVPTADRQKATVRVRIGFQELDPRILPDMGIKVAFQSLEIDSAGDGTPGVAIPRVAVRRDGGRDVVLVITGDTVERRAVHLAQTDGEEAVVLSGLAAGERVVLEGPAELSDGDRVKEIRG